VAELSGGVAKTEKKRRRKTVTLLGLLKGSPT
jgi:hypothetical protein